MNLEVTEMVRGPVLPVISGVTGEDEKWRQCVEDTKASVSFAVGAMYVRKTFHGDSKSSVSTVTHVLLVLEFV